MQNNRVKIMKGALTTSLSSAIQQQQPPPMIRTIDTILFLRRRWCNGGIIHSRQPTLVRYYSNTARRNNSSTNIFHSANTNLRRITQTSTRATAVITNTYSDSATSTMTTAKSTQSGSTCSGGSSSDSFSRRYLSSSSSSSSSSSPWMNQLLFNNTSSIRETLKETIMNDAVRDDSHLWKYASHHRDDDGTSTVDPTTTPLELHHQHQRQSPHGLDGADHRQHQPHSQHFNDITPMATSQQHDVSTLSNGSTINDSNHLTVDMLNDLYVTETTQYWPQLPPNVPLSSPTNVTIDPFQLVQGELQLLSQRIRNDLIGTDHPVLNQAASYFFQDDTNNNGGKKVRPMMVLLLSRALAESVRGTTNAATSSLSTPVSQINGSHHHNSDDKPNLDESLIPPLLSASSSSSSSSLLLTPPIKGQPQRYDLPQSQRRLAEISEMIHTASLFHDDVIDGSDTRRNIPTVHTVFGNKVAILAGDYLLARASICLARLRNTDVVETMSTIIEHLVRGEVMQLRGGTTATTSTSHASTPSSTADSNNSMNNNSKANERLMYYLRKNFYKTASLMANSCKSTALLGNYSQTYVQASYQYGKHIGMAFQLVDDVLDFEGTILQMGKPTLSDLKAGLATAPVLFAAELHPILETLIQRKFVQDGDIDTTLQYVIQSNGIERTKNLARVHAEYAIQSLSVVQPSIYRDALIHLAYKVVSRTK